MELVEKIYGILTEEYGSVNNRESGVSLKLRNHKLKVSKEGLKEANKLYLKNPSATHFNLMVVAMTSYQFWSQKRLIDNKNETEE